ncbi:hypothetical protein [Metapseudomonas otitidis]|nr:hypothetical protein [Pseudomonas otitidis]
MRRSRVLLSLFCALLADPVQADGQIRIAIGEWPPLISATG